MVAGIDDLETESRVKPYDGSQDLEISWDQIERTLREVFFPSDSDGLSKALGRLSDFKDDVIADSKNDPNFILALCHLDPFQIAKDLAGVSVATTRHKELYLELLKSIADSSVQTGYKRDLLDQISATDLARDLPDDPTPARSR